jgi:UDP-N-acetylglucosamine 4,6-dehydratase
MKSLLITGATGTFGTAYINQLINKWSVNHKIIVYSRDWQKQKQLKDSLGNPSFMRYFIGDVRDKERLNIAMKGVDEVIHAAAIKCIDACEYNTLEAIKTNINGSENVIECAIKNKVKKTLLISTDKAVNPINTYGISKAMAEKIFLNANYLAADDNIGFSIARYGNVAFSNGSVIPLFLKLKDKGVQRLPVTHEKCTRYWIDIDKACDLVRHSMNYNWQAGKIYMNTMKSFRIIDLVKALDCEYKIIGLREGEKIHEEIEIGKNSGDNNNFMSVEEIKKEIIKYKE